MTKWILYVVSVAALVGCLVPVQAWACSGRISCDIEISYQGEYYSATGSLGGSALGRPEESKKSCLAGAKNNACMMLCRELYMKPCDGLTYKCPIEESDLIEYDAYKESYEHCFDDCKRNATIKNSNATIDHDH